MSLSANNMSQTVLKDGSIFIGNIRQGKKRGLGQLVNKKTEEKIQAEWKDDKIVGVGLIVTNEGETYLGEIMRNQKNGLGRQELKSEYIYGVFSNGKLIADKSHDKLTVKKIKGLISQFERKNQEFIRLCEKSKVKPFEWYKGEKEENVTPKILHEDMKKTVEKPKKEVNLDSVETKKQAPVYELDSSMETSMLTSQENSLIKPIYLSPQSRKRGYDSRSRGSRKFEMSPNFAISPEVKKDEEYLSPVKTKSKNERSKIYLYSGERVLPDLENIKKLHKIEYEDEYGRKRLKNDNEYLGDVHTDFDDKNLMFSDPNQLGIPLDDYANILEKEKRIGTYYKSYLDRYKREKPEDWKEVIKGRSRSRSKGQNESPSKYNPELWDQYIGKYKSKRVYIPGVRPNIPFDEMTEEEKTKYLFFTDYKPPFDRYVKNRRHPSTEKKARDVLSRSTSKDPKLHIMNYLKSRKTKDQYDLPYDLTKYVVERDPEEFEQTKKNLKRRRHREAKKAEGIRNKTILSKPFLNDNRHGPKYTNIPRAKRRRNNKVSLSAVLGYEPRTKSLSPLETGKGKVRVNLTKRWGDYGRVADLYERAFLHQDGVCQILHNQRNSNGKSPLNDYDKKKLLEMPYKYEYTKNNFNKFKCAKSQLSKSLDRYNYGQLYDGPLKSHRKNSKNKLLPFKNPKSPFKRSRNVSKSYAEVPRRKSKVKESHRFARNLNKSIRRAEVEKRPKSKLSQKDEVVFLTARDSIYTKKRSICKKSKSRVRGKTKSKSRGRKNQILIG